MNYNPNSGLRNPQGPARKAKRVSDVNAMGGPTAAPPPYMPTGSTGPNVVDPMMVSTAYGGSGIGAYSNTAMSMQQPSNYGYMQTPSMTAPQQMQQPQMPEQTPTYSAAPPVSVNQMPFAATPGTPAIGTQQFSQTMPQFAVFQQPIMQDMALQYGQRLADQGKQLVENQFEKYVPVGKLKYYFAVDNKYVINKLRLLFFPFTHKDWSLKYDQENPVQPRYDINAPDLYIPTMAYITYVVVAGLMLGMQQRFSPEQLGIQASSALAYSIFELIVYSITLYVVNIKTNIKTLDLLSFAGYKFVIIVACLLASTVFHTTGYYVMLFYLSLTLGFFLLRTLKTKVLHDAPTTTTGAINYDPYGNPHQLDYTGGRKRKLYFLFLVVGGQAFLAFLLSKHLYLPDGATLEARKLQF